MQKKVYSKNVPTRAKTSIYSQQAHSGNCALVPKKCMLKNAHSTNF